MSYSEEAPKVTTKVSRPHNRTTVPKEVRQFLSLVSGDELVWEIDEDGISVERAPEN